MNTCSQCSAEFDPMWDADTIIDVRGMSEMFAVSIIEETEKEEQCKNCVMKVAMGKHLEELKKFQKVIKTLQINCPSCKSLLGVKLGVGADIAVKGYCPKCKITFISPLSKKVWSE